MKSKLYTSLLVCVGSALVAGTALAQSDPSTQPGSSTGGPSSRHARFHSSGMHLRASKLNGATVNSVTGETLGTIEDLIINPQNGRADFAGLSLTSPTGTTPTGAGGLQPKSGSSY